MSTTPLTQEEADARVSELLSQWTRFTKSHERTAIQAQINDIILLCSVEMQNHAWEVTHPETADVQHIYR